MIYYKDAKLVIRDMVEEDARILTDGEIAQGWHADIEKYLMRLHDQKEGIAVVLAAEYEGNVVGYINVYPNSVRGPFGKMGHCEIVDFGVLIKYRNHGIGSKLMDVAEEVAGKYSNIVYLGVGLHNGYGSAQRMYVKRGFIPDGTGAWYGDHVCEQYAQCCNDDELVLYLSKKLC